ncbi:MAG: DUF1295 domain-containing protein, partial [Planctomycetota bacterium]
MSLGKNQTKSTHKGAVDRSHGPSTLQKLVFASGHFIILLFCTFLIYYPNIFTDYLGFTLTLSDPFRAKILLACAFIYWLRHLLTLFYLLERKVVWSEVIGLLFLMAFFEIGVLLLGGGAFRSSSAPLNWMDLIALFLYLFGSFLNSFSEIQRKWWKSYPANKGHCYTEGLFRYSMHINYFGDNLLFLGWCLFAKNLWILLFPLFMGL